jgi:Skp family chaperone for outer membrane proteins
MIGKKLDTRAAEGRSASMARFGLAAAAILMVLGFGTMSCARKGPGTAKTPDELLTQLKEDRAEIDQTTDTMMKRIDTFNASRKPGETQLQFSEIFSQDLSPEQRDVLNNLVAEEKDVSYKALLQKIIADRDTIRGLQENVMHLEQNLSDKFVVVKRGDKHRDLAMAFLTQEKQVDPEKSKTLLSQIDLSDELLPGNKVWFFYDPKQDVFRTYVTQGEAGQTPLAVRRAKQRQLIQERDTFKNERDVAQSEVSTLQVTKADLESSKSQLETDKAQLETAKAQLESEMATQQNSLFYHAADVRTLKDQGVLSSVLQRVENVKGVQYDESIDLREGSTINLDSQTFGLTEIRKVKVLPAIYQEGRDFTIETDEDRHSARVKILDPDLFKGKEVLLIVS